MTGTGRIAAIRSTLLAGLLAGSATALLHGGVLALASGPPAGDSRPLVLVALATLAAAIEAACAASARADHAVAPAPQARAYARLSGLSALACLVLTLAPLAAWPRLSTPLTAAPGWVLLACVLTAVGVALRGLAIHRLGARFSSRNAIDADAALETQGVYRLLAHPSEVGLLALAAGAALLAGGPLGLVVLPALYALTLARVRIEEAALRDRHGCIYKLYRAARWDPFPSGPWGKRGQRRAE